MRGPEALRELLESVDGRGYKAYQRLRGSYTLGESILHVDHVQSDPFAAPSRVRVVLPQTVAGFPAETWATRPARNALSSYLAESLARALDEGGVDSPGTGHGPAIRIDRPGQEILERTAVQVDEQRVEARFAVALPAAGRRILGRQALHLLGTILPEVVRSQLVYSRHAADRVRAWIHCAQDAVAARELLAGRGLVAFVADGSVLPRRSGVDPRPLDGPTVVPWRTPRSLRVELDLPHAGRVVGTGIPRGVTLIVGGGFHGKSTLLQALQVGVYDHRPGDGRERVVTDTSAVKIRAEDGRRVAGVDISPFIGALPDGRDTRCFTTDNASGSTSQAANIMEALEAGARVLLIDEDTAASNFMLRDRRMQRLVTRADEPITPLLDRVRQLWEQLGVSTVLVVGGSGDFFDVADTVIAMRAYRAFDVTGEARAIAAEFPSQRLQESVSPLQTPAARVPRASSVDPRRGRRAVQARARDTHRVQFGHQDLDLAAVEQLVDTSQTRALAAALAYMRRRYMDDARTVAELLERMEADLDAGGLDVLDDRYMGDHARFRPYELAAALNRLRTLEVSQGRGANPAKTTPCRAQAIPRPAQTTAKPPEAVARPAEAMADPAEKGEAT